MEYVDAHTHAHALLREVVNSDISDFVINELKITPDRLITVRDLVNILDNANIEYIGIMAYPSRKLGTGTEEVAIKVINAVKEYPDRFAVIGGVEVNELSLEETKYWLERQYEAGVSGFKVHPPHMWVKPNAYRPEEGGLRQLELLYQFAEDHGIPVFIHTGTSAFTRARNKYGDPIFVDDVAVDFPRLTIIMAHVGRPNWVPTAFQLIRIRRNIYADLSSIPPRRVLEYIPRLAEIGDKAIYGSDYPSPGIYDIRRNLEEFLKIPIPREVMDKITKTTPRQLLKPLSKTR